MPTTQSAYVTDGTAHAVYLVEFDGDRIVRLDVLADADHLSVLSFDTGS